MSIHFRLTPFQNRVAAVGLLVVLLALFVALFAGPTLWLNQRYGTFIEDYSTRLMRFQRVAALRPTIEAATDEVLKSNGRRFYLHASSPTLAAAELQGLVTKIVESNKGRIASSQVIAQKDEPQADGPMKVTMHFQLSASTVPLQMILHAIETHIPYLYVDSLTVTSPHGRAYKPVAGVQPEFGIQLTVSGYTLPETKT